MFNKIVSKYFIALIIVVFGSGALIFGFNLLRGENLSKPPNFDLTPYQSIDWPDFDEFFPDENKVALEEDAVEKLIEKVSETIEEKAGTALLPGKIYFSYSFIQDEPAKTVEMIDNFIADFPGLIQLQFTDISTITCGLLELPAEQRQTLKKDLLDNELVTTVVVREAPDFEICFEEPLYYNQYEDFLLQYPVVTNKLKDAKDPEHVGYFDYTEADIDLISTDLEQLKLEYSDVVTITTDL